MNYRHKSLDAWLDGQAFTKEERLIIHCGPIWFDLNNESLNEINQLLPFIETYDDYNKWRDYLLESYYDHLRR